VPGLDALRRGPSFSSGERTVHPDGHVEVAGSYYPVPARLLGDLVRVQWDARGESLRGHTARLLALLDDYGRQELAAAVAQALERDALGAGAITHILETHRRQRGQKPPMPLALPDRPGVRDLDLTPHPLESYDDLTRSDPDDTE